MSPLGQVHFVFALVGIASGTAVVMRRKGDRYHRTLGHMYLTSLIALNVTSLFMYRLTGAFNFFHAAALASLFFVTVGTAAVVWRWPRKYWLRRHAYFITGSYVGLLAAAAAESATRFLRIPFNLSVFLATTAVMVVGFYLMLTRVEPAIRGLGRVRD